MEVQFRRLLPNIETVTRPNRVQAAHLEGIDARLDRQFSDSLLDGKCGLSRAVPTHTPRRHIVGMRRNPIELLVLAPIGTQAANRTTKDLSPMIAVRPGVGKYVHVHRRQRAIRLRTELHLDSHRVADRGANELFLAGEFILHGAVRVECRQNAEILGEHFLLASEPTAHALTENPDVILL